MLLLTRRPMMFLLGIGSFLDPAASVLRACISCYGWGGRLLEPNPAIFFGVTRPWVGLGPARPPHGEAAAEDLAGGAVRGRLRVRPPGPGRSAAGCGHAPRRRPEPVCRPRSRSSRRAAASGPAPASARRGTG